MSGTYRKEGSTARVTSLRGVVFESTTHESGVAGFRGGRFFSASAAPDGAITPPSIHDARSLHDRVAEALGSDVRVERLRAISGAAAHRFEPEEGEEARRWAETLTLVHVTIVAPGGARVSVLRGGASPDAIDAAEIGAAGRDLAAARKRIRIAPDRPLVLSSPVAAALAAEIARDARLLDRIPVGQETHPDYGVDGEGTAIERAFASGSSPAEWPNVFRPSYRSPAMPALMHVELAAREARGGSRDAVEMIELLRPPHAEGDAIALEGLCGAEGSRFIGAVRLPVARLAAATAEGPRRWFPFHAGAWGRRTRV